MPPASTRCCANPSSAATSPNRSRARWPLGASFSAAVPLGTFKVLLGHKHDEITRHHSAPELQQLIEAAEPAGLELRSDCPVARAAHDSLHSRTRSPPSVVGAINRRLPSAGIAEESSRQPSHANVR